MNEQPRRVNYTVGMLLTAADFETEQEYHRQMRYLHNRMLHGYGTVHGLDVTVDGEDVHVGPGFAIDRLGREIIVTGQLSMRLDPVRGERRWLRDLAISWREVLGNPVPGPDEAANFARWIEKPELSLVPSDGATQDKLILARLSRSPHDGKVDVDVDVRRPLRLPSPAPHQAE